MKFYLKPKVILISLLFAAMFFRLSYWQAQRHEQKKLIIKNLEERLSAPPVQFKDLTLGDRNDPEFRKVIIKGKFDFSKEMILRNRKSDKSAPGVHILTPFIIDSNSNKTELNEINDHEEVILVNRGFAPLQLSLPANRKNLTQPDHSSLVVLLKASQPKKFLAPSDPIAGKDRQWVDAWLRVDLENIEKQLPYKILPFFGEIIGDPNDPNLEQKIIQNKSEKAEIFMPTEQIYNLVTTKEETSDNLYPIPAFDPVIPAGRHLGYIFEWAALGIGALLVGLVLSLRPSRFAAKNFSFILVLISCSVVLLSSGCSFMGDSYQTMVASYYGDKFHGRPTANGEIFDAYNLTAAHKHLPFGTLVRLTNPKNNRSCLVRINDRGPFIRGRDIDVSYQAAYELGMIKDGVVELSALIIGQEV